MIIFNSLEDVCHFANNLILNNCSKTLRKLPPETIIDLTVGATHFVALTTYDFAHKLGHKIIGCNVNWIYNGGCTACYLARCYSTHYIEYTAELFLLYPYEKVLETIVHEICHCKYMHHTQTFWEYMLRCLKVTGLISFDTEFKDYFSSHSDIGCDRPNEIRYYSNFRMIQNDYSKYDIIRTNRAFNLRDRSFNLRKFHMKYDNYIHELKYYYNVVSQNETAFD